MTLVDRPVLSTPDARALLTHTRDSDDPLLHAAASLLLLAGLRPREVEELHVADYTPGAEPQLSTGSPGSPRRIRLAPSAAGALDLYLAGQDTEPEEPLLMGLQPVFLVQLVRRAAEAAGVSVGAPGLRQAAIAAALEDGTPVPHIQAYFGLGKTPGRRELVPVPEGYDAGIAAVLEATFAAPALEA